MIEEKAYVISRNGTKEEYNFPKISARLENLAKKYNLNHVDYQLVTQKVIASMYPGITTSKLDENAAIFAMEMGTVNLDYADFGTHIYVDNMHKNTPSKFSEATMLLSKTGLLGKEYVDIVMNNADYFDGLIVHDNDHNYSIVGYKTLERGYLLKVNDKTVERPQYMLMRKAINFGRNDLKFVKECYEELTKRNYTHATPTCFNSGLARNGNLSSCFLLSVPDDSIEGIAHTVSQCMSISKSAGGIGFSLSNIRARGSEIKGTQGISNGIVPMLKVFDEIARYVDQGGGKRKGSLSPYLEMWHKDMMEYLQIRLHTNVPESRTPDLHPGLWISDLFMKRVFSGSDWTFFCPTDAPKLQETWGEEFETWYHYYERNVPSEKTIVMKASDVLRACAKSSFDSGLPYFLFKDAANRTSNQQHLGTIKGSNLCTEIIQYTSDKEVACCNLASIALQRYVTHHGFDFEALGRTVRVAISALDKVIDITTYPCEEARYSNLRHRPLGLGVQGLADVFMMMHIPFDSLQARELNKKIFECIYWHAVVTSIDLAEKYGAFESFAGSPTSMGKFQFDLWNEPAPEGYDWETQRERMKKVGIRNSLLTTVMPTVSTSTFLGSTEMVEPINSNFTIRQALAGDFKIINRYLVNDLKKLGLWDAKMKDMIIANDGSIQSIPTIPDNLKEIYKTIWEISQKVLIQYARDRAPFICQSQSLNIYLTDPTYAKFVGIVKMAWELGLITGIYYLRTKSKSKSIQFTIQNEIRKDSKRQRIEEDTESRKRAIYELENDYDEESDTEYEVKRSKIEEVKVCSLDNREGCISCSS
jgi:ribonucleoside-diphosphate reductase alpha chain